MEPEWLGKKRLALDADLRELQLRWLRDEIWMRRIVFGIWAVALLLLVVALLFAQARLALGSGIGFTVLSAPVFYFFRAGRQKSASAAR